MSFPLVADLPALSLLATAAPFTGRVTLPSLKSDGALGGLLGPLLTGLTSGANNAFSLTIAPPTQSG